MPSISSFIYCYSNSEKKMITFVEPDFIPGNFTFNADFSIVDLNPSQTYTLRIDFKGPEDEVIFKTDDQQIQSPDEAKEKKRIGVLINFEFKNVPLKTEGLYKTSVYLDNVLLGTFAIPVMRGSDQNE
ncbi:MULTISPECIES: DUF6941 family protein [Bacillus]|uniref:DUF6941 family protein n=1 Tax=Bacillus paralicheniformis TaxID=1648923 RepID=UPI000D8904E5|nr:hypothetical protein [Bacillus paralicheniformis]KAA0837379.1 hypothetical protein EI977_15100 [Bacillus paralicheniformis]KAA0842637.1 hypothetical protein EI979_03435 [Bacillus paralicheniformis]QSG00081.1 hypothetical protein DI291_0640 [Bacillus paralicheniformis]